VKSYGSCSITITVLVVSSNFPVREFPLVPNRDIPSYMFQRDRVK
jgi:hypothetical protein